MGETFQYQIQQVLSEDLLAARPLQRPGCEHATALAASMFQIGPQLSCHQNTAANNPTNLESQQLSHRMWSESTEEISPQRLDDLNQPFQSELTLSDQVWRSAISQSLSPNPGIYMHDQSDTQLNSGTDTITKENLFRLNSGTIPPATLDMTSPNALANWALSEVDFRDSQNVNQRSMTRPTSHGLIIPQADQYRSWSGAATSSSMSSQGDSTARFSGSPEPQQPQMRLNPPSNSGSSTLDRASCSDRLSSQFTANIRRTTSCGDQHEIQKALSFFEAQEKQEQWRQQPNIQLDPALTQAANLNDKVDVQKMRLSSSAQQGNIRLPAQYESTNVQKFPSQAWQHDPASLQKSIVDPPIQLPQSSNASLVNQASDFSGSLLRTHSLSEPEVVKEVDTYHLEVADISCDQAPNMQHEPRALASAVTQNITSNLRGRRRWGAEHGSIRGSGPIHAGHDEAAINHMLAERRRRVKQKENFAALRRLVPIISKADKASTLVDAITYLKDLQKEVEELKASKENIEQRYETLDKRCKELEDRNRQLVATLSKDQSNSFNNLNSMKSI